MVESVKLAFSMKVNNVGKWRRDMGVKLGR